MNPALISLIFLLSLAIITRGADWFISSAVKIARALGLSTTFIGVTLVSLATTAPEFFVSTGAAWLNHPEIALGNAVGSIICNTGLVLCISILFSSVIVEKKLLLRQGLLMIGGAGLLYLFALSNYIYRWEGLILLFLMALYVLFSTRSVFSERANNLQEGRGEKTGLKREIFQFIGGGIMVVGGSRALILTAVQLARILNIPEVVISLSIISLGTSLPELVTAITAIVKGHVGISVGNIIGANILNILWVIGASSLIQPLPLDVQFRTFVLPIMFLITVLAVIFGYTKKGYQKWEGGVILALYISYIGFIFYKA